MSINAADSPANSRRYFGCAGVAFIGLVFWLVLACCFLLLLTGLATELPQGDPQLTEAYYGVLPLAAISGAFTLMITFIVVVFLAYGMYHRRAPSGSKKPARLVFPILLAGAFLGSTLCSAGLPVVALLPKAGGIYKGLAISGSGLFCIISPILLWFAVDTYERYRAREDE